MQSIRARWLLTWFALWTAACSSPTEPAPPGYSGEWAGTTAHGTPVSFSVSGDQVTSFTLAFNFSPTCFGTETIPGPRQSLEQGFDQPGFAMSKVVGDFEWGVAVAGAFSSDRRSASGESLMMHYPGCSSTLNLKWSARRR